MYKKYIMLRNAKSISEAQELIRPLVDIPITNAKLGMTAVLSNRSIKKLGSEKATSKSVSPALHAKAVANIDVLYENAEFDVTHPDSSINRHLKQIHRLGALMFDEQTGEYVPVAITVKEPIVTDKNKIYTVEALDVEKKLNSAGRTSGLIGCPHNEGCTIPITEFNVKMQELLNNVKKK